MSVKKIILSILTVLLFLTININAYDTSQIDDQIDIDKIIDSIPEEYIDYLPDNSFGGNDVIEIATNTNHSFFLSFILNTFQKLFPSISKILCSLLGLTILTSLINTSKNCLSSDYFSKTLSFITSAGMAFFLYETLSNLRDVTDVFMQGMNTVISALLPVMTLLYTMGGNVSTAVINSSAITLSVTVFNEFFKHIITPLLNICFGLSLACLIGGINGVTKITKTVKTIFTVLMSGSMTVLSIILLFKTNISASADGVTARTIKFAGSFIPVVGSALGESVRSVMSSISLIKNSVGYVGIVIIAVITLPPLLTVILNKFCIDLSAGAASMLGCEKESLLLEEFSSMLGFMLAVLLCFSILFVFELTVFVSVSPALGAS